MKLTVDLGALGYDVVIKRGGLANAGKLAHLGGKVLLISSAGVPEATISALAAQCGEVELHILGESETGGAAWQGILSRMAALGFCRTDLVAALGGSSVCALAGFAAATYLGGVPWVCFPTTLRAQFAGATLGKGALCIDHLPDVAGTWHSPELVMVDPALLPTLPPRQFASGVSEALKAALMASGELFELLENEEPQGGDLERMLYLAVRAEKGLIERDPACRGERRLLDFGHTLGRALLAASAPGTLLAGESTVLGMLPMIENRVLLRRVRTVAKRFGLPLKPPPRVEPEAVFHALQASCARDGKRFTVARVKQPGHGILETIEKEEMWLLVQEFCR